MNSFTIKDLENLSGIKAHTIRIWEQRYNFLKPQRTGTNIRYYTNDELKLLLNVALLNKYGFKVSHINRMSEDQISQHILNLNDQQAIHDILIKDLIESMISVELDRLEQILDNYITSHSIEKAITHLFLPFLERIGILWLTNHINPAQEHLVSNIVRQKIIVAIEELPSNYNNSTKVLLFLPENEHHELGLLFIYYLLKKQHIPTLYLGSNVPLKDLAYIVKVKSPAVLYTHITSTPSGAHFEKFINKLEHQFQNIPIIISGAAAQQFIKTLPANFSIKKSIDEVQAFVNSL